MASIRARVGRSWAVTDYRPSDASDTSTAEAEREGNNTDIWSGSTNAYEYLEEETSVSNDRRENYEMYEEMDDEYSPVGTGLDIYADNCTQIGMTSDAALQGKGHIVKFISPRDDVLEQLAGLRERVKLDERAWALARSLAKMGDVFEEVVVNQELEIERLKQLPPDRMIRKETRHGLLQSPAFIQVSKQDRSKAVAAFDDWEVIHYRMQRDNEDKYGTSVLKSVRKLYRKMTMIEDSMVIARLTRANMRMAYYIDTGSLPPPQAREHVNKMKQELRKKRMTNQWGRLKESANPLTVEEDIFMGVSQNSKGRVEQLYGDLNIGNLTDVEYFQNQFYGGIKVPKSYAGVERDVQGKQTLTMQDIQFARSVRRLQLAMRTGYRQLTELFMALQGSSRLDKRYRRQEPTYAIAMPGMQTQDELREWEMKRVQAEVARYYVQELYLDPVSVYVDLLGFSEVQAQKMFKGKPDEYVAAQRNKNEVKSYNAKADKKLGQAVAEAGLIPDLMALRELTEMALEKIELEEAEEKGHVR